MEVSFLVYQVTVRCNSRCRMCSIWQLEPGEELYVVLWEKGAERALKWVVEK